MKRIDTDQLKALAQAATGRIWKVQHPNAGPRGYEVASGGGVNQVCDDCNKKNAEFIAANPSAILELIETLEQLRAQRDELLSLLVLWRDAERGMVSGMHGRLESVRAARDKAIAKAQGVKS